MAGRRTLQVQHSGLPSLPKVTPHALRRTYISLMLEAGAPLPYVMDQVGHLDSKTTLEIYAQVQKRVSRKKVHLAFDELLANAVDARSTPTADPPNVNRS
jgi:integrase